MSNTFHYACEPLSDASGSLALSNRSWFALTTRPRFEKKVTMELKRKGFEIFLPTHASVREWSDRRRLLDLPLFPGYVFVKVGATSSMRIPVLRTDGVLSFVGLRGMGSPIPDNEISTIQKVMNQRVPVEFCPFPQIGQTVRIRGGGLNGVEGVLKAIRGNQTLVVSIELIQRSIAVHVSGCQVEAV